MSQDIHEYMKIDDDREKDSWFEKDRKFYEKWFKKLKKTCKYTRIEMNHEHEQFRRLSKSSTKRLTTLKKLISNANIINRCRKRYFIWNLERNEVNLYHDWCIIIY